MTTQPPPLYDNYPETIAVYVDPPEADGYSNIDVWDAYFLDLIALSTAPMDYRPDAYVLPEPCNWAEVPHRALSSSSGRVPTADVRSFISDLHQIPVVPDDETSEATMDAWGYMSERGVLMVGIDSWAFGDEVLETGLRRGLFNTAGSPEGVGFKFNYTCPQGTTDLDLSFLHYDEDNQDGGGDSDDENAFEDLRLHVYIQGATPTTWIEVGQTDPHYAPVTPGDPHGGFRFNDPDREEMVELIKVTNITNQQFVCDNQPHAMKIVAECHAADGKCDGFNPNEDPSDPGYVEERYGNTTGNFGYVADVQIVRKGQFGHITGVSRLNLTTGATAVRPTSSTAYRLLSKSNANYRYLQPVGITTPRFDSVIVRYDHGLGGECAGSEFARCSEAQARLMGVVGDVLGPDAANRSLNYFEAQTWKNIYDREWLVEMLDNTEDYTDGLVGGHYSLAYWELTDYPYMQYGEMAMRTGILPAYDDNPAVSGSTADAFSLFFFGPGDRKFDALPGWYQHYSIEYDFATDPTPPSFLSFEFLHHACVGCGLESNAFDLITTNDDDTPDTIVEINFTRTDGINDGVPDGENDPLIGEIIALEDFVYPYTSRSFVYDGAVNPNLKWLATEGKWLLEVTMYTIDKPQDRRHGFFRMIDADFIGPSDTYELPGTWDYESGIWTDTGYGPDLSLPVGSYNPTDNVPESAEQARDMNYCLRTFWLDTTWGTRCLL